ncbi:MAG: Hpt domain-containing protein, partial [Pseudomonadota bacterium]
LRRRNVAESMKNVARVARKMQLLFAGTEAERYWFTLIGLCEGIAGGLIQPDECIAQIFKTGAFLIKYAAENGSKIDERVSYEDNVQRILFYIAACKSKPVHIARIRKAFEVDDETLANASRGLVHIDAVMTALGGATHQLESVMEFINSQDLHRAGENPDEQADATALEGIEAAEYRLDAAGLMEHAESLRHARVKLAELYRGLFRESENQHERAVNDVIRSIVDVKLDVEHKLVHGINNIYSNKEFELRESVVSATFTHMSLVENHLHQILRRKALASAIAKKASDEEGLNKLSLALHRHLNKSDTGQEELRQALAEADKGNADVDRLLSLAKDYLNELEQVPDRKAINAALRLLDDISGALYFAGLNREGDIIAQCYNWLAAASKGGSVREDDAFQCCAEAFAQLELHLHRSLLDPLDDTSPMMAIAEKRAAELEHWVNQVSRGSDVANPVLADTENLVQDGDISPEFREVFIEEAEEIAAELTQLAGEWAQGPEVNQVLRDIRRHFHTFKGNGRAVGANILGELGWAAQDMLDCVLDGDLPADRNLQNLVFEIIGELPALVASYRDEGEMDVMSIRQLTNRCFALAKMGADAAPDIISADGSIRMTNSLVSPLPATGTSSQ